MIYDGNLFLDFPQKCRLQFGIQKILIIVHLMNKKELSLQLRGDVNRSVQTLYDKLIVHIWICRSKTETLHTAITIAPQWCLYLNNTYALFNCWDHCVASTLLHSHTMHCNGWRKALVLIFNEMNGRIENSNHKQWW